MKLILIVFISTLSLCLSAYPVAVFHGIGDACSNSGMENISRYFSKQLGGVYVRCIESAGGLSDFVTSFKYQAEKACEEINSDPNFHGMFSVVGISQGALLARYIIESCQMPGRVKRYVSIGGPQMGVGKVPHCENGFICRILNGAASSVIYSSLIQNNVGPSGYFKDISNYSSYLSYSTFLSELNNEKSEKDTSRKERFMNLENLVLIKFSSDSMIIPRETAWFQFYNEKFEVEPLTQSAFYNEDFIGLRTLNEQDKIKFVELPGEHLHFGYYDIDDHMIPYLK